MKYLLAVGYVNRPDLLQQSLQSIKLFWLNTMIIDNSDHHDLRNIPKISSKFPVFECPIHLNYSQIMNLLQRLAEERGCDVVMFIHNDAEAHPGTPEKFLDTIESLQREKRRWGITFTNYDILVAFNMEAVRTVGRWDTNFPQYFSDIDYYRRLNLAGYEHILTNLPVTHHVGSITINSDPGRKLNTTVTFPLYQRYYEMKWGGPPGQEKFTTPFNR